MTNQPFGVFRMQSNSSIVEVVKIFLLLVVLLFLPDGLDYDKIVLKLKIKGEISPHRNHREEE